MRETHAVQDSLENITLTRDVLERGAVGHHLSPVHTSNNVEATFDFVAKNGNNVERVLR